MEDKEGQIGQSACISRITRNNGENESHLEIADNLALMYLGL